MNVSLKKYNRRAEDTKPQKGNILMKKISNDVALKTILYIIKGTQKIKVIDFKKRYENTTNGEHKVVFEGFFKDVNYDTFNYWQERASIFSIIPDNDVLVIGICTSEEIY